MAARAAQSIFDQPVIQGQDTPSHQKLHSAVYPNALKEKGEGRFLTPGDAGTPNIVISRKIARDYPGPDGKPRAVGATLHIGGKPYQIIGLYETGSMLLDVVIIMDIATARDLLKISKETVSSIYVEAADPRDNDALSAAIQKAEPSVEARSMSQFLQNFGALMGQVDKFLLMTVSLALLVGVVGIVNTMLMSTSERFVEFGVLRTNGWSKSNLLTLVTIESAYLGLLSGVVGCVLALIGVTIANQFVEGGVRLTMPPWLIALGVGLSVVTGTLGGLYPAWRRAAGADGCDSRGVKVIEEPRMSYEIRVEQVDPKPMIGVRRKTTQPQLSTVIPQALGPVWEFIRANGVPHSGINVAYYLDGEMNIDVGVYVSGPFVPSGELLSSATPGGTVATTSHFGPYHLLGGAHHAIHVWCQTESRRCAGPSWEVYGHWSDDPAKLRTDVYYLLE